MLQKVDDEIAVAVQKKRGSKSASIVENNTATPEEVSQAIQESFQYFNRPIVKTDEECAERLNEYFSQCYQQNQIPTVEDMCLALGTVRQTVWDWEVKETKGKARADMIKKAKEILAGIDSKLVQKGKIPQVVYIFRAKNFYGLRDQTDLVLTPTTPLGAEQTPDAIQGKYKELPED